MTSGPPWIAGHPASTTATFSWRPPSGLISSIQHAERTRLTSPSSIDEGLKHESSIHCDELMSLSKASLTNYVGSHCRMNLEVLGE